MSAWAGKTPTAEDWRSILEKHAAWKRGAEGGERADLQDADLQGADLQDADLHGADLQGADLQGAYLQRADLQGAYLQDAYLQGAHLQGAYLQDAYLQGAHLQGADLQGADLHGAYLQDADLHGAYLHGAKNADYAIACTRILPEGELIGWKKCRNGVLVRLRIPSEAKRSHAFGRKCRAEFADVVEVVGAEVAQSLHDAAFEYRAGQRVKPDAWDEDFTNECSSGIHFFITKAEAEAWQ